MQTSAAKFLPLGLRPLIKHQINSLNIQIFLLLEVQGNVNLIDSRSMDLTLFRTRRFLSIDPAINQIKKKNY
jgi:hypothetical protein